MGLIDTLTSSFMAVWRNPKTILLYLLFVIIAGIVTSPFSYLIKVPASIGLGNQGAISQIGSIITANLGIVVAYAIVLLALELLVVPLIVGTFLKMGLQSLQGTVDIGSAFGTARSIFKKLVLTFALQWIISLLLLVILVVPYINPILSLVSAFHQLSALPVNATTGEAPAALVTPIATELSVNFAAVLPLILIGVVIFAIFSILVFQIMVVILTEQKSGVTALRRSIQIGWQNFWRILLLFILFVIAAIVVAIAFVVVALIVDIIFSYAGSAVVGQIISQILILVLTSLLASWFFFFQVYFYQNYVRQAAMPAPAPSAAPSAAQQHAAGRKRYRK
jgi:membrane-anchored glycerophosphoryl diester phosphodiesterase (GDPDase)